MRFYLFLSAVIVSAIPFAAQANAGSDRASWLQLVYERSSVSSDGGSNSSSSGQQSLIETVMRNTDDGVVLRYDLPRDEAGNTRTKFWYFPADVLERPDGSLELLDVDSVKSRIDQWLTQRNIPREACGHWTHGGGFPYRVDCDPDSILDQIEAFDLRMPRLEAGAEFSHPMASSPGILERLAAPRTGYFVVLSIDQQKARAEEAKNALILAQMLDEDLSREQAESDAAQTDFQGSIRMEFDLEPTGSVIKMSMRTNAVVTNPDGTRETKTSLVTVERHDVEAAKAQFGY
ncbi:hypothetical protein GRI43_03195 [Altererythrobacter luteolus]|uniref:Secreted protein n=1 Tax=Pontixanthobacter luteolus TaxID=295089 RepID=A0A6I4UWX9_9SPHN|nr:hypothetical protein [Pontixanthobacter luteolus]MXP46399.1 hypothetical protein [Pontixanthobacter luteolus]